MTHMLQECKLKKKKKRKKIFSLSTEIEPAPIYIALADPDSVVRGWGGVGGYVSPQ